MSKVMLVEDDNNLREIYEARLQAEGYDIVTAHDGEEALVVAKAENPDLVISDVMMPKISGFEMLDILRNTDGLKDVKVIMLTALGQSDDQQRADKLGADAYLVKSQVTLEDIVKVAQRLLGGGEEEAQAAEPAPAQVAEPVLESVAPEPTPEPQPVAQAPEPVVTAAPEPVATSEPAVVQQPIGVVPPLTLDLPPLDPPATVAPQAAPEVPVPAVTETPVVETPLAVEAPVVAEPTPTVTEPVPAIPTVELPEAEASSDESADIMSQIAQFEAEVAPTPLEVAPVTEPVDPSAELPAEQYMTTAAPDLTTAAPAPDPAVAGNNEDVLNTALENLTGLPAVPGQEEPAAEASASEAVAPGNEAVQRGGGRVITPIESAPKPDLNTLLAVEEAKEAAVGSVVPPIPPLPTTAVPQAQQYVQPAQPAAAPAPAPTPVVGQQPGQSIDPNSIAL